MKRLIVSALAGILLATGCSNSDGSSVQSLRAAAGVIATPQASPPTETPPAPAQPTETPPAISTEIPQPPQVIEVTHEVQATVQVEVTRVVVQEIQVTPQPTATPACNVLTPAPTMTLDASDIAAGVIVKGGWPCGIVGYPAYEVQP